MAAGGSGAVVPQITGGLGSGVLWALAAGALWGLVFVAPLYYLLLASSIQRTGGPLSTVIIGTLPVVIAIVANRRDAARDGRLPWRRLWPALALIAVGIALVNHTAHK